MKIAPTDKQFRIQIKTKAGKLISEHLVHAATEETYSLNEYCTLFKMKRASKDSVFGLVIPNDCILSFDLEEDTKPKRLKVVTSE